MSEHSKEVFHMYLIYFVISFSDVMKMLLLYFQLLHCLVQRNFHFLDRERIPKHCLFRKNHQVCQSCHLLVPPGCQLLVHHCLWLNHQSQIKYLICQALTFNYLQYWKIEDSFKYLGYMSSGFSLSNPWKQCWCSDVFSFPQRPFFGEYGSSFVDHLKQRKSNKTNSLNLIHSHFRFLHLFKMIISCIPKYTGLPLSSRAIYLVLFPEAFCNAEECLVL